MTKKELLETLKDVPPATELYMSLWDGKEQRFILKQTLTPAKVEKGTNKTNFFRISWVTNCAADKIREINGKLSL